MEASRALSRRVARSFKSLSCQCRGPKSAAAVALASCLSAGLRASGGGGVPLRPWATTTASLLRAPLLSPGPLFASFACWASGASRGVKLLASAGLVGPSAARRFSEPDCPRDSSFSKPTKEDLAAFRELLAEPESQLLWAAAPLQEGNGAETARGVSVVGAGAPQGPEGTATQVSRLAPYLTDWLGVWTPEGVEGAGAAVLFPRSTQEVQSILKHCSSRRLAVAVQGGNTGLVGGSVPVYDEVVLSLAKMNRVLSFDAGECRQQPQQQQVRRMGLSPAAPAVAAGEALCPRRVSVSEGSLCLFAPPQKRASWWWRPAASWLRPRPSWKTSRRRGPTQSGTNCAAAAAETETEWRHHLL